MKKERLGLQEGVIPSIKFEGLVDAESASGKSIREFFGFREEWDEGLDGFAKNVVHALRVGLALFFTFKLFEIAIALVR